MPRRIGDFYEVPTGQDEQTEAAEKESVAISSFATQNEFHSGEVTIGGTAYSGDSGNNEEWDAGLNAIEDSDGEIPGLRCPDCDSQAYKTDHPHVAVCGDYPGWYFFFKKIDRAVDNKPKYVIKNGELVEVTESEAVQNE